jgi:hypothetical protein
MLSLSRGLTVILPEDFQMHYPGLHDIDVFVQNGKKKVIGFLVRRTIGVGPALPRQNP